MAVLYRVENPDTAEGLWYDGWGNFTEYVKTLDDGHCRDLPMPYDPAIAGGWFSACDNLDDMSNWFSLEDLDQLAERGYGLYEVFVPDGDVREVSGHAVFRRENAKLHRLPIGLLDKAALANMEQAFMGMTEGIEKAMEGIRKMLLAMFITAPRKQLIHNGKKP